VFCFQISKMTENINTSSALTDVAELLQNEVPENDVNSGSCTVEVQNEPKWFRDGDAWVKIFLEPVEPGKFKQHDYVYDVPGENEFPKERWSSAECIDGFHITRRRHVWAHLKLHGYKSAYIAEVVSMGDEFYDNPHKRKVRVVTFGTAVRMADVLGKHPDDFKNGHMLVWSVANKHIELVKLAVSKNSDKYNYDWAFGVALENGSEQIADFFIESCKNNAGRQEMLIDAIRYGRADFVKRLVENTSDRVSFFRVASVNGQFEIFQLLCDKYGKPPCSDIILTALCGGNVDILKYLKSRGVDISDFEMFVYACTYAPLQTVEYLVSEGADVNHPLVAYIAKRQASKEVREYLLSQIDDKSEVQWCEKSEGEIYEICITFYKRINAGEIDGK
jgi:hypothetical protein